MRKFTYYTMAIVGFMLIFGSVGSIDLGDISWSLLGLMFIGFVLMLPAALTSEEWLKELEEQGEEE